MVKTPNFISDYLYVILGFILLGAGRLIDFSGLHGASSVGFWLFIVLCLVQAIKPQRELDKYKKSNPNVVVKKAYLRKNVETKDFIRTNPDQPSTFNRASAGTATVDMYLSTLRQIQGSTRNTGVITTDQTYVVIDFANNPPYRRQIHDALDVICRINYFDQNGNNILKREIKGLWEGVEPTRIVLPKPDYEFTQMTIPSNGDERSVCIAIKKREDKDCFAFALESYGKTEFLKNQNLNIGTGEIRVEIILSGRNLPETPFTFRLINLGIGSDITISEFKDETRKT